MISTVPVRRFLVLIAAAAIALLFRPDGARSAEPSAQDPNTPGASESSNQQLDTVTIEAERERQLKHQISDYVSGAVVTYSQDSLERWNSPVCPAVGGLPKEQGEFILARLSQIAREAHAPLAGEHCNPNLVVVVTDDPDALVAKWSKRYLGRLNTCNGLGYLNEFLHSKQVVRVYYNAGFSVDGPHTDISALELIANFGSFHNSCASGGVAGTRLSWGAVQDLRSVIIVVDSRRTTSLNIGQVADYVAMVGLAQIRPDGNTGSAPTILSLFGQANPLPTGLSPWDQSFLQGLYTTRQSSVMQTSSIETNMFRQIASARSTP